MKKNIIITILVISAFLPSFITAQTKTSANSGAQKEKLDRSIRPQPGPAPVINIGEYSSFTLDNGLKVFVVENHKIPRVSYSLTIDYTPVKEGEMAGLADLTGQMLRTGTTNLSKDELDEEIDFIGASLYTNSNGMYASGLKKHNEKLLQLMSDVLLNPSFASEELEKIRTRTLTTLETEKTEPGAISNRVGQRLVYGEVHPYGESMNEKSVKSITIDACKNFYSSYFQPQISYMAVVGDITLDEAKEKISKYFSSWPKGTVPVSTLAMPAQPSSNVVAIVDRPDAVQTTLSISYPVDLKPGTPEAIKASVANTILGGGSFRLFNNLREDKGYTYGAYSRLASDKYVGIFRAYTEIRNSVTDSAINEILFEMNRLCNEPVPAHELSLVKNYIGGNFALSLENPSTIANFAINTARYNLPDDYYTNYLKNLSLVSTEDVSEIAAKYIKPANCYILAVGNAKEIAPRLQSFSKLPVKYFDFEGKEYDPSKKLKPAPEGVTALSVNEAYIEALGGRKVLSKVKDVTLNATTNMQGMTIGFDIYRKAPNKYMMKLGAGEMIFQQVIYDGEEAVVKSPMGGGDQKLEGEELENYKYEAILNPELRYDELGIKLELQGIETIDEKDAYKVVVTLPNGKTNTRYFDVTNNLLIRETSDQGQVDYKDYRVVDKIKFPYSIKQAMGPQMIELNVIGIKINSGLKDDIFTIM